MRACLIATAVIVLTQPALATESHKKKPHRIHVADHSHHHAARHHRGYARLPCAPAEAGYVMAPSFNTNVIDRCASSRPFVQNQSWRQAWAAATPPAGPFGESVPFGESGSRMRGARLHDGALDSMIARHAAENGLPIELVHRVVTRESGYNPHARSGGNLGLMQIKYATARGAGYDGAPSGLMDPETNLTYAVRYLAGAYRAAGGNANRAVRLYASGYRGRGVPSEMRVASTPWQPWPTSGQW